MDLESAPPLWKVLVAWLLVIIFGTIVAAQFHEDRPSLKKTISFIPWAMEATALCAAVVWLWRSMWQSADVYCCVNSPFLNLHLSGMIGLVYLLISGTYYERTW